jgi:hypothetical protein
LSWIVENPLVNSRARTWGEDRAKAARGKVKLARTFALKNQVFARMKQIWREAKTEAKCPVPEIYLSWSEAQLKGSNFWRKNRMCEYSVSPKRRSEKILQKWLKIMTGIEDFCFRFTMILG